MENNNLMDIWEQKNHVPKKEKLDEKIQKGGSNDR
jgi:hypothetical protein